MGKDIKKIKKDISEIGKILWEKNLVSGLNGNISCKVDDDILAITAHKTCLGYLEDEDVLKINYLGDVQGNGQVSTEKSLHTDVYKSFDKVNAIIHTHTSFISGYFLSNRSFSSKIIETKLSLGEVVGIDQDTPSVTDTTPIIDALKSNNIVVLRNHGVLAVGDNLVECFMMIQALEEAIKVDAVSRLYSFDGNSIGNPGVEDGSWPVEYIDDRKIVKYALFSQEQIDEIVKLANNDEQLSELGKKSEMTMDLAVKLDETGQVFSFSFKDGKIENVGNDDSVEFLINAPESIWRAVFNREIDPFVATTQKKMNLRGDFARISKFYAPCSRLFELWAQVPVE